jgi:uncharacterized protein
MISTTPHQPPPSTVRRVLMLPVTRLILSLLIAALVAAAIGIPLVLVAMMTGGLSLDPTEITPKEMLLQGIITAPAAVAALYIVGRLIERRPPAAFGFPRAGAAWQVAVGFAVGVGIIGTVVQVFAAMGWYRVTGFSGAAAMGSILAMLIGFLLVSVSEEVFFRGIVFRIVEEGMGTELAFVASCIAFGFVHAANPGATLLSSLLIVIEAGVLLGAAYLLTRSLWLAIGIHWGWNFAEGPIFGTRVSGIDLPSLLEARITGPALWTGGEFGPEAGLVAGIVATGAGVYLLMRAYRLGHRFTPAWMAGGTARGTTIPMESSPVESAAPAASAPSSPP